MTLDQLTDLQRALAMTLPNGVTRLLISLTHAEWVILGELVAEARERLVSRGQANISSSRQAEGTIEVALEYAGRAEPLIYEEDNGSSSRQAEELQRIQRDTIQSLIEACREAVFAFECEVPLGNSTIALLRAAIAKAMTEQIAAGEEL